MKKMARNEDAFTQRFEQQKGSGLVFFSKKEKKKKSESESISCKHGTEGLHGKNIWSVPTFFRSGPIFSCSVNGALGSIKKERNFQIQKFSPSWKTVVS